MLDRREQYQTLYRINRSRLRYQIPVIYVRAMRFLMEGDGMCDDMRNAARNCIDAVKRRVYFQNSFRSL